MSQKGRINTVLLDQTSIFYTRIKLTGRATVTVKLIMVDSSSREGFLIFKIYINTFPKKKKGKNYISTKMVK